MRYEIINECSFKLEDMVDEKDLITNTQQVGHLRKTERHSYSKLILNGKNQTLQDSHRNFRSESAKALGFKE